MKTLKYIFTLLSILSLVAIGYCYYFARTFLFNIRIEGLQEMFCSAIALWLSAMGLVLCGWIGNKKRINYLIKDSVETHKKLFTSEDVIRDLTKQLSKKIERVDVLNEEREEYFKANAEVADKISELIIENQKLKELKIEHEQMYSEQLQINADQDEEIKGLHKKVLEWSNLYDNEVKEHTKSLIRPSCLRTKSKKKSKPSPKRTK